MTALQLVGAIFGTVTFACGAWFFAIKAILSRHQQHLDEKLKEIVVAHNATNTRVAGLEGQLNNLRVEVAQNYMRREDWIRRETESAAKLDSIAKVLKDMQERLRGRQSAED